jgi:hypothetical protein
MRRPAVKPPEQGHTRTELRQGKIARHAAPEPRATETASAEEAMLFAETPEIPTPLSRNAGSGR